MASVGDLTVSVRYDVATAALHGIRTMADPEKEYGRTSQERLGAVHTLAAKALAEVQARNSAEDDDRRGIYRISPKDMLKMMRYGFGGSDAVPLDTKVEGAYYDGASDMFCLIVSHPSFDRVMPGGPLPRIEWKETV